MSAQRAAARTPKGINRSAALWAGEVLLDRFLRNSLAELKARDWTPAGAHARSTPGSAAEAVGHVGLLLAPKTGPRRPKTPSRRLKLLQDTAKKLPRRAKTIFKEFWDPPEWASLV